MSDTTVIFPGLWPSRPSDEIKRSPDTGCRPLGPRELTPAQIDLVRREVAEMTGPFVTLFEDFATASGAERVAALRLSHTILNRLAAIDARLGRLEAGLSAGRVDPPGG